MLSFIRWLSSLESTKWYFYLSTLIQTARLVVHTIHEQERCVAVHCSDGWDRTSGIVALAELLLDPFYRTIAVSFLSMINRSVGSYRDVSDLQGFQVLIEREWLDFGHKFSDRSGHGADHVEYSPVFLQWLDAVHQVLHQHPTAFEFNSAYIVCAHTLYITCIFFLMPTIFLGEIIPACI